SGPRRFARSKGGYRERGRYQPVHGEVYQGRGDAAMKYDHVYLQHIRDLVARIVAYTAGGREAFFNDTMVQDAVLRNIEVIGEAVKNLSQGFRDAHADVPWRAIAGMRDRLIHGYTQVNLDVVWLVVE